MLKCALYFICRVAAASLSAKRCLHSFIEFNAGDKMRNDELSVQSINFAVSIVNLVKRLKEKRESVISNQIGRSGTSVGANIREAQYAHSKADFIAKLQIALKETNDTGYWLELLHKTDFIPDAEYKQLDSACTSIRVMLIASINTAKENRKCEATASKDKRRKQ